MLEHTRSAAGALERVVVLGASGFVGGVLLEQLTTAGVPVLALSSQHMDLTAPASVESLANQLRRGDTVVLLSAITRDKGRDGSTFLKNVAMAYHVTAAAAGRCSHMIYVSSDAVYGDHPPAPLTEAASCDPSDLYGLAHLARERVIEDGLRDTGIPLAILRSTMLYGPQDTHASYGPNRFLRSVRRERSITLFGAGEERRDFVYIDDLAGLIRKCAEHRSRGILNVASGQSVTFAEVAKIVSSVAGADVSVRSEPRTVPIRHRQFDVAATMSAFPSFHFIDLGDGIARTWRACA